jgi:hypothetical protein
MTMISSNWPTTSREVGGGRSLEYTAQTQLSYSELRSLPRSYTDRDCVTAPRPHWPGMSSALHDYGANVTLGASQARPGQKIAENKHQKIRLGRPFSQKRNFQ